MKTAIGAAILAAGILAAAMASPEARAAAQTANSPEAVDLNTRHRDRRDDRHVYRPAYQPHYYGRPTYYRPYPYESPVPFFLGFGFDPWW